MLLNPIEVVPATEIGPVHFIAAGGSGMSGVARLYAELGIPKGALPLAEEISATELSLPMFYGMTDAQVQAVIDAVNEFEG